MLLFDVALYYVRHDLERMLSPSTVCGPALVPTDRPHNHMVDGQTKRHLLLLGARIHVASRPKRTASEFE